MSTTFEFNLPYTISLNLIVQCNCSNESQLCANLTRYISLKTFINTFDIELMHLLSLIQCNCSNKLQTPANLTSFIALQTTY